jgi:hypothetical protein
MMLGMYGQPGVPQPVLAAGIANAAIPRQAMWASAPRDTLAWATQLRVCRIQCTNSSRSKSSQLGISYRGGRMRSFTPQNGKPRHSSAQN